MKRKTNSGRHAANVKTATLIRDLYQVIDKERNACSRKTTVNRQTAVNRLRQFISEEKGGRELTAKGMTKLVICEFYQWHKSKGLSDNYFGCLIANLRPLLKELVGRTRAGELFEDVTLSREEPRQSCVGKEKIKRLAELKLEPDSQLERARDIALFCFMACGLPFVDAAYLRKDQLKDGHITFLRKKTNVRQSVTVTHMMQRILDRLSPKDSPFLLPILTTKDAKRQDDEYQNRLKKHNLLLNQLGGMIEPGLRLTSYSMRYAWANIAAERGESINYISCGMMHRNIKTTQTYLQRINQDKFDEMCRRILDFLVA